MIKIQIDGPGLVINGPAFVILEALKNYGFQIDCEDWCGKDQWVGTEREIKGHILNISPNLQVRVDVNPIPWGG